VKATFDSLGDRSRCPHTYGHDRTWRVPEIPQPDLSVVIPSVNGWSDLEGCLQALAQQSGDVTIEVLVADRVGERVRAAVRKSYPHVRVLEAPSEMSIPALRALAFREARGEIVGVIEDHVIVPPDWARKMLAAHAQGAQVVGGSVDNAARERIVDWAAFLCEYSHCLAPPVGCSNWLTGNNVTYRRILLERFQDAICEERWEDHLHDMMRRAGVKLESRPEIQVGHKKHYTVGEYLYQRYLYARSYAGMRIEGAGPVRRLALGLASFALPPLLFYRTVSRVLKARRNRRELVRSLPLLVLFVSSWAVGEAIGYWRGPGDTLGKVC
jgi:glycosyltransferase involved in cell wall biosynthesis